MANSNVTKKDEFKLRCPSCLVHLKEPRAFTCFHMFCQRCIDDIKPIEGDASNPKLECPLCKEVTVKDNIQSVECINELLKIANRDKNFGTQCDKCNKNTVIWRCHDCKANYCHKCYDQHNGFPGLKNHTWEKLTDGNNVVLDKHVYCQHHPAKHVEIYCKDCKKMICLLCNGTEHKSHEADTIDEAVKKVLKSLHENSTKLNEAITEKEKVLQDTTEQGERLKKTFEDIEKRADRKCEDIICKAREDCKKVKQQLASLKEEEFAKMELFRKELEMGLQCQKNNVALSGAILFFSKGTSFLQLVESGVGKGFETGSTTDATIDKYVTGYKYDFDETFAQTGNMIGFVSKQKSLQAHPQSDWINLSLKDMSKMSAVQKTEIKSIPQCPKFMKINNELWFSNYCSNEIGVYSLDGTKLRSNQYDQVGNIQSITKLRSNIVLSASNGLYIAELNQTKTHKLLDGDICDVSIMGDDFYVLDNGAEMVRIFKSGKDRKSLLKQGKLQIEDYHKHFLNTIQVTKDSLYIAIYFPDKIFKYDHGGTLLTTFTSCNATIGKTIYSPFICGVDVDGSLLIVRSQEDHRAIVLTVDGEWLSLSVTGLAYPKCAYVENDRLWVYDSNNETCFQYHFK